MVRGEEATVEKVVKEELDVKMLQMAEMLASLMARSGLKEGIEKELKTAFKVLMMETYAESGRFFLTKNADKIDSNELTHYAVRAIGKFNEYTTGDPKQLKVQSLREYFLTKISASECVKQAAISLRALDVIVNESKFTFVRVVAGETQILGLEGSITL